MTSLVEKALDFATVKHQGQTRFDGTPYVEHPKRVMNNLKELGITDENILAAALLHDTIEDTQTTAEEIEQLFNMQVVSLVLDLTSFKSDIYQIQAEQETKFKNGEPCAAQELLEPFKKYLPDASDSSLFKRAAKAVYLTTKLNKMPLNSKLVKLSDRLDNMRDLSASKEFVLEYSLETKYILEHVDTSQFTEQHKALYNSIQAIVEQNLN